MGTSDRGIEPEWLRFIWQHLQQATKNTLTDRRESLGGSTRDKKRKARESVDSRAL